MRLFTFFPSLLREQASALAFLFFIGLFFLFGGYFFLSCFVGPQAGKCNSAYKGHENNDHQNSFHNLQFYTHKLRNLPRAATIFFAYSPAGLSNRLPGVTGVPKLGVPSVFQVKACMRMFRFSEQPSPLLLLAW